MHVNITKPVLMARAELALGNSVQVCKFSISSDGLDFFFHAKFPDFSTKFLQIFFFRLAYYPGGHPFFLGGCRIRILKCVTWQV